MACAAMRSPSDPRQAAGGRHLQLTEGPTHLVDEGCEGRSTLLPVHGATVPHREFALLVPHLRATASSIVRFDLFGHGLSDRPSVRNDITLFLGRALAVLDARRPADPRPCSATRSTRPSSVDASAAAGCPRQSAGSSSWPAPRAAPVSPVGASGRSDPRRMLDSRSALRMHRAVSRWSRSCARRRRPLWLRRPGRTRPASRPLGTEARIDPRGTGHAGDRGDEAAVGPACV
jgi:hypothetical protein